MLQLKNIRKSYKTGNFTQVALDDISISFRDNEFAAILGPSGSGKTTMLNIIGGLDHYDEGDLIIDGISTKDYNDKDWDTFRNNRIGFVFQSYNLIPHQSILANVELALTLSGVSREERRARAIEELERVGLGEHINKKPSQLSGGQMQRVAIARALVNDPEILLADEPTGALDSKTSLQIMDLLTEIAKDRLVVMVTHNPELADTYATRIVNLSDGHITADTDPFVPTPADLAKVSNKKIRRTSMNFLTALSLSFNNLMTKKGRTIMTAFAGSIGIIGIAAILSLANGVNNYIKTVEEETLSVYPLQITSTGFDMTAMMANTMGMGGAQDGDEDTEEEVSVELAVEETPVREANIMNRVLDSVGSNDLASLKEFFDSGASGIEPYVSSIDYSYNVTPYIYEKDTTDGVQQVNPDNSLKALGMGSGMSTSSIISTMMSTDQFSELMDEDLIAGQYDLKAGHWPEKYNEVVLVLTQSGSVSDYLLYITGLRDRTVMEEMVRALANDEDVETEVNDGAQFTYGDFLNLSFKLVNSSDFYTYDEEFGVWVDKSGDEEYMKNLVNAGEDLVISGIVQANPDSRTHALSSGLYYRPELIDHIIEQSGKSKIVQEQLAKPTVDVFNGKLFTEEDQSRDDFDMSNLFSIDTGAIQAAFKFDQSKLQLDMSDLSINFDSSSLPAPPAIDPSALQIDPSVMQPDETAIQTMMTRVLGGFFMQYKPVSPNPAAPDLPTDSTVMMQAIADYMGSDATQAVIAQGMASAFDTTAMTEEIASKVQTAVEQSMTAYMTEVMTELQTQMTEAVTLAMTKAMNSLADNMSSAMSIDEEAFMNAFTFDMTEEELSELMMSMMSTDQASFDNNLAKLDYAQKDKPYEIDIYAKDFDAKQHIIDILDAYNARMNDAGEEAKAITYTDIVGTMMASVTTIIDMISYVLIAFVSISLIVSSIMIGVITYISVLERKKEIGILRAIGASKRNISQIFNAETVIEGLISGIIGVGITALGCIPASAIVYSLFDVPNVALLPWQAGLILIAISVFLSFIAGLIPASSASRKDPVEALRSE